MDHPSPTQVPMSQPTAPPPANLPPLQMKQYVLTFPKLDKPEGLREDSLDFTKSINEAFKQVEIGLQNFEAVRGASLSSDYSGNPRIERRTEEWIESRTQQAVEENLESRKDSKQCPPKMNERYEATEYDRRMNERAQHSAPSPSALQQPKSVESEPAQLLSAKKVENFEGPEPATTQKARNSSMEVNEDANSAELRALGKFVKENERLPDQGEMAEACNVSRVSSKISQAENQHAGESRKGGER